MKMIKKIGEYKVTVTLVLGWLLLSAIGYLGKDTAYEKYETDVKKTPYFALVFQGFHDEIYPWDIGRERQDFGPQGERIWAGASPETGRAGELVMETETETETESGTLTAGTKTAGTETVGTEIVETEVPAETEEVEKEFVDVDESYFDDAVFIGDSRTVGLHDYGGLDKADYYATVGLNVYDMWEEKFDGPNGEKIMLEEALTAKQYGKVYFQIGINEMGRGTVDSFMEAYAASVWRFRELQPDAIIYVQAIMHVTKEKSDADSIFNNPGLVERNDRIAALADNRTIFYIDMNEVVCDEEGNLKSELTFDNLHLYGSQYYLWVDFLKTKGIA